MDNTETTGPDTTSLDTRKESDLDEFYVGYLPMPPAQRHFIKLLIAFSLFWALTLSAVLVMSMRSPGEAVWQSGQAEQWAGILIEKPYPMLIGENDSGSWLVVNMGKTGAHDRLDAAFNHRVVLSGYELHRQGRRIIELELSADAIEILAEIEPSEAPEFSSQNGHEVELVGEIVDGKCYLGAMKPGDGFGHRACATLCLEGGLPPMFAAETESGSKLYPLLIVDDSTTLSPEIIAQVACRVRIKGTLSTFAGLPMLSAESSDILDASSGSGQTLSRSARGVYDQVP